MFYQVKSIENSFSFAMKTWQEAPADKTKEKTDKKKQYTWIQDMQPMTKWQWS